MSDNILYADFSATLTQEEKIAQYKQRGYQEAVQLKKFYIPQVKIDETSTLTRGLQVQDFPAMNIYRKAFHSGYIDGLDRINQVNHGSCLETKEELGRLAAEATIALIECEKRFGPY